MESEIFLKENKIEFLMKWKLNAYFVFISHIFKFLCSFIINWLKLCKVCFTYWGFENTLKNVPKSIFSCDLFLMSIFQENIFNLLVYAVSHWRGLWKNSITKVIMYHLKYFETQFEKIFPSNYEIEKSIGQASHTLLK